MFTLVGREVWGEVFVCVGFVVLSPSPYFIKVLKGEKGIFSFSEASGVVTGHFL